MTQISPLHRYINASQTQASGNLPGNNLYFQGTGRKESRVEKRDAHAQRMAWLTVKVSKFLLWVRKHLLGFLPWFKADVTKADKTKEELLQAKRPEKVSYPAFTRPTTGISQAKHPLNADHPLVKHYQDDQYLHILDNYGISWDEMKVARDTLQNFYDGQGQTLDNTQIEVSAAQNGKSKIRIAASATYDADKLLGIGSTGKNGTDVKDINTGGFGEGAKQLALCLLRDYGAETVTFRSREWQVDFTLKNPGAAHTTDRNARGLHAKLTLMNAPIAGNDVTFTTSNKTLADIFKNQGKNLYYHAGNTDFQNPTYANEIGGFKILPGDQAGNFYHAGQRRAVDFSRNLQGMAGLHIWTNKKLLTENDRDRNGFSSRQIEQCLETIVAKMSVKELGEAIRMLTPEWFPPDGKLEMLASMGDADKNKKMLLNVLCEELGSRTGKGKKDMPFELPKGLYTAGGYFSDPQVDETLKKKGYIPVESCFRALGVPSAEALMTQLQLQGVDTSAKTTPQDTQRLQAMKSLVGTVMSQMPGITRNQLLRMQWLVQSEWRMVPGPIESENPYDSMFTPVKYESASDKVSVNSGLLREVDAYKALVRLVSTEDWGSGKAETRQTLQWLLSRPDVVEGFYKAWNAKPPAGSTQA